MKRSNIIAIIGIVTTITLAVLTFAGYSQDKQDTRIDKNCNEITSVKVDIATIQTDVEHIKGDIAESKEIQQSILEKLDDLKDNLRSSEGPRENRD